MTIMSIECAKRLGITKMIDNRWSGVALGIGKDQIFGRIHLTQIQIEDVFLQCSFTILNNQNLNILLGLDMLRR